MILFANQTPERLLEAHAPRPESKISLDPAERQRIQVLRDIQDACKRARGESTPQSNLSKSSNEPAEEIFNEIKKPEQSRPKTKTKVKVEQSRPKNEPWYTHRSPHDLGSMGLCPRCGSGSIRRPTPLRDNVEPLYKTHYRCHHCGHFFKQSVKDWDPEIPWVEPIIEPPSGEFK